MLLPDERDMFEQLIINREGAIAFDWTEVGRVYPDVSPDIFIKTIPHNA